MIKKNGTIQLKRFSNSGILDNMEIKYFENAVWAKVFEHNNHAGTVLFTTIDEVKYCDTADKYSRLKTLDNFKATDSKIEFLLQYPDNDTTKYNRWKQTNNPLNEFVTETTAGTNNVTGYEAIHIDWNVNYWGGVARQKSDATTFGETYLDGSVGHGNWYYAIGCKSIWSGGIPGPNFAVTARVQLWVRIDTLPEEDNVKITKSECLTAKDFHEI